MNLRQLARGRDCTIRVPHVCAPGPDNETVVGCHVRLIGVSGAGLKSPNLFIAFGCFACHQVVDGHVPSEYSHKERRLMLLEGMVRTQEILLREGLILAA